MLAKINNKKINKNKRYVIGLDFGTDSARAVLLNVDKLEEITTSISYYKRWKE